jgi:hypothetical protein
MRSHDDDGPETAREREGREADEARACPNGTCDAGRCGAECGDDDSDTAADVRARDRDIAASVR